MLAQPAGAQERQPDEHLPGRGHQDGDHRGGHVRHRQRDPFAGEEWDPAREDLAPAPDEPALDHDLRKLLSKGI